MFKALIFDMDGVLVDSHPYIWHSFQEVLREQEIILSDKEIKQYIGLSLRDQMEIWKKEYGLRGYTVEEFSQKSGKIQFDLIEKNHKHDQYIYSFINQAKKQGMRLAVATNSSRWRADKMLEVLNIKKYFDVLVTSDDVTNHKPHPDMFLLAAERLGVHPKQCIVFEDALSGIQGAKNANMKAVALITRFHTRKELEEAHLVINDFSEIDMQQLVELYKKE